VARPVALPAGRAPAARRRRRRQAYRARRPRRRRRFQRDRAREDSTTAAGRGVRRRRRHATVRTSYKPARDGAGLVGPVGEHPVRRRRGCGREPVRGRIVRLPPRWVARQVAGPSPPHAPWMRQETALWAHYEPSPWRRPVGH